MHDATAIDKKDRCFW